MCLLQAAPSSGESLSAVGCKWTLTFWGWVTGLFFWSGKLAREGVKHAEYKYRNQKGCIRRIWVPQLPSYWEKLQHEEQDQCAGGGSGSSC